MEDQQKLQQILAQLEVYKSQSELYQTQIDAVQTSLAEIKIFLSVLAPSLMQRLKMKIKLL